MLRKKIVSFFSLFGSSATLLCCALPAALSIIAGGTAVGALLSTFPWLIPLSKYKIWIFIVGGFFLFINGIFVLRPQGKLACSINGGKSCEIASGITKGLFWFSLILYSIGAFFAYALVPIMRIFE